MGTVVCHFGPPTQHVAHAAVTVFTAALTEDATTTPANVCVIQALLATPAILNAPLIAVITANALAHKDSASVILAGMVHSVRVSMCATLCPVVHTGAA